MKLCPRCNSKLKKSVKFCPECGTPVVWEQTSSASPKGKSSKRTTIAIFLVPALALLAVIIFFVFGGSDLNSSSTMAETATIPESTDPSIAFIDDPAAITVASQSVVKLSCYDKQGELYTTGSGFACFADDVIVTNYHVIADEVYSIDASTEDGRMFHVKYVLATDADRDIAILSTETPHNLVLLQQGNCNDMQKGEKVVAIGSPLGLLNSVSTGVFSGYVEEDSMDVLQFTASISSGSSGGALFNNAGEVLGITYASYETGQNLNLAVPISDVAEVYESSKISDRLTIPLFYDTFPHTYTVDYVMEHAQELDLQEVTIEGYVSYTYGYINSDGEPVQALGLVANQDNVLGSIFTLDNWDYNAANQSFHQGIEDIAIRVSFIRAMDMQQFLSAYSPGTFTTCTGKLYVSTPSDWVMYFLHVT